MITSFLLGIGFLITSLLSIIHPQAPAPMAVLGTAAPYVVTTTSAAISSTPPSYVSTEPAITTSVAGNAQPTTTASRFASGAYDCTSTAASVVGYQGEEDHSTVGGSGTLPLTPNGSRLEAVYSGDANASGTLDFVVTSDSSANPVPGQTITVGCGAIDPTTFMQVNAPTPGEVTAAALTTDGTALSLTFLSKTSGGACTDQTASTVLVCTPKG